MLCVCDSGVSSFFLLFPTQNLRIFCVLAIPVCKCNPNGEWCWMSTDRIRLAFCWPSKWSQGNTSCSQLKCTPHIGSKWCKEMIVFWFSFQALHLYSNAEQRLEGPMGQVHALVVFNDLLLAGAEVYLLFLSFMNLYFRKLLLFSFFHILFAILVSKDAHFLSQVDNVFNSQMNKL